MVRRSRPNDDVAAGDTKSSRVPSNDAPVVSDEPQDLSVLTAPPGMRRKPYRPAQPNIPNGKSERDLLRDTARRQVDRMKLVPPLAMDELGAQAEQVCRQVGANLIYRDYVAILVNNETWRDSLARIPYDRRLLLLPQCLRDEGRCPAPIDEFGLLCQACGQCSIHDLQGEAERLGYAVLVAEGSAVVMKMIETGRIQAIVGVSCMSVLEKCFSHMEARAVPALAIPLLQDGCADTSVDLDWVREAIYLSSQDRASRLNLDALKREVQSWFTKESLSTVMGSGESETEAIAHDWLARSGKRWRPYLTACVYMSLHSDIHGETPPISDDLKRLAMAVECFHKASLIHDDIEDGDEERYGQKALHVEHGMPVALNVGDYLLGEGYRLIGELEVDDRSKVAMLRTAAAGHLTLSRGQGAELCWASRPRPLSTLEVLDIFRQKTAPAFEVALRLGAIYGSADEGIHDVLRRYSEALGVAYQIRDDLEDFFGSGDSHDLRDLRPSVVLAIAHRRAGNGAESRLTHSLWKRTCHEKHLIEKIRRLAAKRGVIQTVENLLEVYIAQATQSLHPLQVPTLKGLLRRVIGKIFRDEAVPGYCREFEAQHAEGRTVGAEPAA